MWETMLRKKLRVDLPSHVVKEILKTNLNLSFKKENYYLWKNKDRYSIIKSIFATRVAKKIPFVDKYRWNTVFKIHKIRLLLVRKKRKECIVRNVWFSNSVFVIASITSAGTVFTASLNGTVTGNLFKEFLKKLKDFIQLDIGIKLEEWLILLDNASTHQSTIVRNYAVSRGLNFAFIPEYSSEWAPIKKCFFIYLKGLISIK